MLQQCTDHKGTVGLHTLGATTNQKHLVAVHQHNLTCAYGACIAACSVGLLFCWGPQLQNASLVAPWHTLGFWGLA